MNATQLANVLQKIKTDPVLQETLRVTKQDWVELNLTSQETFWGINSGMKNANEISDYELENLVISEISLYCTWWKRMCDNKLVS
jgi:hypothetical protein